MSQRWIWILPIVALALTGAGLLGLKWVSRVARDLAVNALLPPPGQMYPPAPPMPAPVTDSVESLLARYEKMLADQAPAALAALQPGLTDARIDALETKHGFRLTPDLRALYRWRNGEPQNAPTEIFPEHRFVPLDEAASNRDALRAQVKAGSHQQQQVYATYAGHRDPWLGLIEDGAGDGYFFDPTRTEAQGSFFYCFAEDGTYTYFPAFRNYLAAVIEGHDKRALTFGPRGAETADFHKADAIWTRHSASPPPPQDANAPAPPG